jgi:hypothetical protein
MATTNAPFQNRTEILGYERLNRALLYRLCKEFTSSKPADIAIDFQKQRNDLTVILTLYNPYPERRKA